MELETASQDFMQAAELCKAAYKGDSNLYVKFSMRLGPVKVPVFEQAKTSYQKEDGTQVTKPLSNEDGTPKMVPAMEPDGVTPKLKTQMGNVEFVEIRVPGDRTMSTCEPVKDSHRARFPKQYAAFKSGLNEQSIGTPIAVLFPNNPALVSDMQHAGVHTIQQLANLTDGNAQQLGPVLAFRKKAQEFLAAAKGADTAEQLAKRDAEIEALKVQMAELLAAKRQTVPAIVAAPEPVGVEAEAPKRRGRPPKAQPQEV